jgi:two-component system, OmpR family, phosphate regulon sensor histidine kinase PhoR
MLRRSSLTWPIMLAVALLAMIVVLLVIWIIAQAREEQWALLTVGTIFFALILVGVIVYVILTIKGIRITQRQANFIDAVTHELKSPIASIKLCLQTLDMRPVSAEQAREFHKFMLDDVQRLDALIDHLLAVARLDNVTADAAFEDVPLDPLLRGCIEEIRRRYKLEDNQIRSSIAACTVRGRPRDLEMVFLNLLDNAVKYGGQPPQVQIDVQPRKDAGPGVRFELRSKIFRRFFRGGTELERVTKGTGLGLFLVKSLVSKMKGRVQVHGRGPLKGATFELELPGRANAPAAPTPAESPP